MSAGVLEKLKGLVAVVKRKLGDGIAVPAYGSHSAFLKTPKEAVKERNLYAGDAPQNLAPEPGRRFLTDPCRAVCATRANVDHGRAPLYQFHGIWA